MGMLFQIVDKVKVEFLKALFAQEKVKTDTLLFRCHYKLSVWLVVLYSLCYMYVNHKRPMQCMGETLKFGKSKLKGKTNDIIGIRKYHEAVTDYCWISGTFAITNLDPEKELYPGFGEFTGEDNEVFYHHYYKWMYYFMAVMFVVLQVPRYIWRTIENGLMKSMVKKLDIVLIDRTEEVELEKKKIVQYFVAHIGYFRYYAFGFIFSEFLNLAVSLFLMLMWDMISEHEFSTSGTANLVAFNPHARNRSDRLAKVFPIISKCVFNRYGPGGNIEPHDFICVLPLNVINERFAVFFWYYFMALVAFGSCALIFRCATVVSPRFRAWLLSARAPLVYPKYIRVLSEKCCSYSDWFVLYHLGACLNPVVYREVLEMLIR